MTWLYREINPAQQELNYTSSGIRYLSIGDASKQPLVLIHGAPGGVFDWRAMARNEKLYEKYRLIIVERPGYGGTKPRGAEPSIITQAERILEVLENDTIPAIVMGHSYGAPIAVAMGALQAEKIQKIIGVSGQYDPNNEITYGISYFIRFKIFKYLLPRLIWVANEEKLSHPEALEESIPLFSNVKVPVTLIHGDADSIVPYENSTFLQKMLNTSANLITLKGFDHPLQMETPNYLADFVLDEKTPLPKKKEE